MDKWIKDENWQYKKEVTHGKENKMKQKYKMQWTSSPAD
jgi:hypothetical protein